MTVHLSPCWERSTREARRVRGIARPGKLRVAQADRTPHPAFRATFSHKGPVALLAFGPRTVGREAACSGSYRHKDGVFVREPAAHAAMVAHLRMLNAIEASRTCPLALVRPT